MVTAARGDLALAIGRRRLAHAVRMIAEEAATAGKALIATTDYASGMVTDGKLSRQNKIDIRAALRHRAAYIMFNETALTPPLPLLSAMSKYLGD